MKKLLIIFATALTLFTLGIGIIIGKHTPTPSPQTKSAVLNSQIPVKTYQKENIESMLGFVVPDSVYDFVMIMPHPMDVKNTEYYKNIDFEKRLVMYDLLYRESRFDSKAVSAVGCKGMPQLSNLIFNHYVKEYPYLIIDYPRWQTEIIVSSLYIDDLLIKYDDWKKALNHYNSGNTRVGFGEKIVRKFNLKS
jgi:hypothetical protein